MVSRFNASQIRSKLRQIQQKQRQAISKYNHGVRQASNKFNQAVNRYNQAVRTHNARVRANRQRFKSELARLSRQPATTKHIVYTTSVRTLHQTYSRLEQQAETEQWDPMYNRILDLSEREAANSLQVTNRLLGDIPQSEEYADELEDESLFNHLREISEDLDDRWRGAVFSLDPNNPDAARHFCTSSREILDKILEIKAVDAEVLNLLPTCERTSYGKPTRKSKIKYLLHRKGMIKGTLEEFVEQDMKNIVELFDALNKGTHGSARTYDLKQLAAIKRRVGDGIMYLSEISRDI